MAIRRVKRWATRRKFIKMEIIKEETGKDKNLAKAGYQEKERKRERK